MKDKKFPVVEIFGPTVQGEGVDQGVPCHFIRFGGCDFKCSWCDTPHAVLAENVRRASKMTSDEIVERIRSLAGSPELIVISGGNPLLHELGTLVLKLQASGYRVAVETQGTLWKEWLRLADVICVSPKPPSSGMRFDLTQLEDFIVKSSFHLKKLFLKVVVFDQTDYEFASMVHKQFPLYPFYLSAGNDAGATVSEPSRRDERSIGQVRNDLFERARWLTNRVMVDPVMRDAKVQAQFHVALWGNEKGR